MECILFFWQSDVTEALVILRFTSNEDYVTFWNSEQEPRKFFLTRQITFQWRPLQFF